MNPTPATRPPTKAAIEARGLGKTYPGGIEAVASLDLVVPRGSIYALLGPNGAGKTTAVSMLTTLATPTAGQAWIDGLDVVADAASVRRAIGVTFQETVLDDALTGRQVLEFHGRLYGQSLRERRRRADELLELTELTDVASRKAKVYSGGMKRRLELARALMTVPSVLFLDEPTLGLDPQGRARIWDYVRALRRTSDLTVLVTTHYLDEAQQLADRVGIMDAGRLVVEGSPDDLIDALGSDTIRVRGQGVDDALDPRFADVEYVESFTRVEGGFLVGVDSASRRLADVISRAADAGFSIDDVSVAKPDLGAVFFQHTGRSLREGAPA
jgi:ABC-2 type transport system ATP-binding protein